MRGYRALHSVTIAVLLIAALLVGVLPRPTAAAAEPPQLTAARVNGNETRTRFVADLTASLSYHAYVLPDPYRVIVDLPIVDFKLPRGSGGQPTGLVREYRFGALSGTQARIVIETEGPVELAKTFMLKPQDDQPARLVVDMVATTAAAFERAYREQEDRAGSGATASPEASAAAEPETPAVQLAAKPRERRLIVVDPGHGGMDPGAIGLNKTREKDVVLTFARALQEAIQAAGKFDVRLTRDDDRFLSLKDRVRIARDHQADLFIAVHADTVRGQSARGATLYTLSDKASDAEAAALAEKENRADIIAGVDLGHESPEVTDILIDLVQRESRTHSMFFARKAAVELKAVTLMTGKPVRSAGFVVLKAPDVPSVLLELGYLSSHSDEELLTNPAWHKRTAAALNAAIERYFATEIAQRQ
jgi:N-acetylmuramoyl-L-alanine amidase